MEYKCPKYPESFKYSKSTALKIVGIELKHDFWEEANCPSRGILQVRMKRVQKLKHLDTTQALQFEDFTFVKTTSVVSLYQEVQIVLHFVVQLFLLRWHLCQHLPKLLYQLAPQGQINQLSWSTLFKNHT
jgi:hypothetical protein